MPPALAVPGRRAELTIDVLAASFPLLASLALSLPTGPLMPFRLATLALVVLAAWAWAARRRFAAPRTVAVVAAVGASFALFGVIAAVRFRTAHLEDAVRVALMVLLAAAFAALSGRRRTVVWLLYGWLAAAAVCLPVALWELATGRHLPTNIYAEGSSSEIPRGIQTAAFFDNPNLYAYQCALVLLVLPAAFTVLPRGWRLLVLPFGAVLACLLAVTGGRLALVAALLGLGWWALRSRGGRVAAGIAVLTGVVATAARLGPAMRFWNEAGNALVEFTQEGASSWVRAELARSGWWMTETSSFLGVGPGGFEDWALRPDNPFVYGDMNNAHSGLVEVLAEYGVITAVLLLAALAAASVLGLRAAAGRPVWDADRALAFSAFTLAALWPVVSASHSTWLRQPLSAAHVATLVALVGWTESRRHAGVPDLAGDALTPARGRNA